MIELIEIMRQKNDNEFTTLLNTVELGLHRKIKNDIECLQSKSVTSDDNNPTNTLHILAGNKPVDEHDTKHLQTLPAQLFILKAIDQYPAYATKQDIDKILAKGRSETGGLDSVVFMKEGARVMVTANIDIADRLINGQMGTTVRIAINYNTG